MKLLHLICVSFMTSSVLGWWNQGHYLTAIIAHRTLESRNPQLIIDVERILNHLKESRPSQTRGEYKYPFVECASWAEEV